MWNRCLGRLASGWLLFLCFCCSSAWTQSIDANMSSISLFVGTYTEKMGHVSGTKADGIYVLKLAPADNRSVTFDQAQIIRNVTNPSFLEITKSKKYMYAVTESGSLDKSLIHGYELIDGDHSRYIDSWPIGGVGACHVCIDDHDRFVFVSDYNGGNIASFKIDPGTGHLYKRNFFQFTEHSNVNPDRQEAPHLHSSIVDSQTRFVYFLDLGNDCIWRFNYSEETGFQTETKRKFQAPAGSGPRHSAFHPSQPYLYVACELTNHVLVYQVDGDGGLQQLQYEPTTPRHGPGGTADIHVSPDGRFVYVTTRFLNIVSVFQVQDDGKLKLVQEIDSGGKIPRNFVLHSPLELVLVANQDSDDVTVFSRDASTGKLKQVQKTDVNTPVCLKIRD